MKTITEKELRKQQMVDCDHIDLGIVLEEHWWISFSKVEEDLIYFHCGYEPVDSDDITFTTMNYGLKNIKDFLKYMTETKKQLFGGRI